MPKQHIISLKGIDYDIIFKAGGGGLVAKSCLTLVTPWTVACQAALSMGIRQERILEWVTIPFSRGFS